MSIVVLPSGLESAIFKICGYFQESTKEVLEQRAVSGVQFGEVVFMDVGREVGVCYFFANSTHLLNQDFRFLGETDRDELDARVAYDGLEGTA